MKKVVLFTLFCVLVGCATASADVVELADGRVLEGEITEETAEHIKLKLRFGTVTFAREDIVSIEKKATPLAIYDKKASAVEATAAAHYALGIWCKEHKLRIEAQEEFQKALSLDPDFEKAAKQLGLKRYKGKWLSEDEIKEAQGFVRFRGEWIKKEKRDRILHTENAKLTKKYRKEENLSDEFYALNRPPFVILSALPKKTDAERLADVALAVHNSMKKRFSSMFKQKKREGLKVLVFKEREGYKKHLKEIGIAEGVDSYGYYHGKMNKAFVFYYSNIEQTMDFLQHECCHQVYVNFIMLKTGVSAWVFDGMAEYFEGFDYCDGELKPSAHSFNLSVVKQAIEDEELILLEKLLEADYIAKLFDDYEKRESWIAYAQAWAWFYFLMEGGRRGKLLRYIDLERRGKGSLKSFKSIFGSDLNKLESEWKKYILNLKTGNE